MEWLKIVALSVLGAVVYGVLHDQVTARVCVEYFTIGHPRIIQSQNPAALALAWGVVATWWVGLPLGFLLALAARAGSPPRLTARDLLRPMAVLLGIMAAAALVSGIAGYSAARSGRVMLTPPLALVLPPERHAPFIADLWAHSASYLAGLVGGLGLAAWTLLRRWRPRTPDPGPATRN